MSRPLTLALLLPGAVLLSACMSGGAGPAAVDPQDAFFANLSRLCGKAFAGRVVTNVPAEGDFDGKRLTMHVRECTADTIRVPFNVGEDRSRTWVISRTGSGLRLKHDHRHADGTSDALTMYGGDTATSGTPTSQAFPVDAESVASFVANKYPASTVNVWHIEVTPTAFAYILRRPNRDFRVEFDLTREIATPPAPWGR